MASQPEKLVPPSMQVGGRAQSEPGPTLKARDGEEEFSGQGLGSMTGIVPSRRLGSSSMRRSDPLSALRRPSRTVSPVPEKQLAQNACVGLSPSSTFEASKSAPLSIDTVNTMTNTFVAGPAIELGADGLRNCADESQQETPSHTENERNSKDFGFVDSERSDIRFETDMPPKNHLGATKIEEDLKWDDALSATQKALAEKKHREKVIDQLEATNYDLDQTVRNQDKSLIVKDMKISQLLGEKEAMTNELQSNLLRIHELEAEKTDHKKICDSTNAEYKRQVKHLTSAVKNSAAHELKHEMLKLEMGNQERRLHALQDDNRTLRRETRMFHELEKHRQADYDTAIDTLKKAYREQLTLDLQHLGLFEVVDPEVDSPEPDQSIPATPEMPVQSQRMEDMIQPNYNIHRSTIGGQSPSTLSIRTASPLKRFAIPTLPLLQRHRMLTRSQSNDILVDTARDKIEPFRVAIEQSKPEPASRGRSHTVSQLTQGYWTTPALETLRESDEIKPPFADTSTTSRPETMQRLMTEIEVCKDHFKTPKQLSLSTDPSFHASGSERPGSYGARGEYPALSQTKAEPVPSTETTAATSSGVSYHDKGMTRRRPSALAVSPPSSHSPSYMKTPSLAMTGGQNSLSQLPEPILFTSNDSYERMKLKGRRSVVQTLPYATNIDQARRSLSEPSSLFTPDLPLELEDVLRSLDGRERRVLEKLFDYFDKTLKEIHRAMAACQLSRAVSAEPMLKHVEKHLYHDIDTRMLQSDAYYGSTEDENGGPRDGFTLTKIDFDADADHESRTTIDTNANAEIHPIIDSIELDGATAISDANADQVEHTIAEADLQLNPTEMNLAEADAVDFRRKRHISHHESRSLSPERASSSRAMNRFKPVTMVEDEATEAMSQISTSAAEIWSPLDDALTECEAALPDASIRPWTQVFERFVASLFTPKTPNVAASNMQRSSAQTDGNMRIQEVRSWLVYEMIAILWITLCVVVLMRLPNNTLSMLGSNIIDFPLAGIMPLAETTSTSTEGSALSTISLTAHSTSCVNDPSCWISTSTQSPMVPIVDEAKRPTLFETQQPSRIVETVTETSYIKVPGVAGEVIIFTNIQQAMAPEASRKTIRRTRTRRITVTKVHHDPVTHTKTERLTVPETRLETTTVSEIRNITVPVDRSTTITHTETERKIVPEIRLETTRVTETMNITIPVTQYETTTLTSTAKITIREIHERKLASIRIQNISVPDVQRETVTMTWTEKITIPEIRDRTLTSILTSIQTQNITVPENRRETITEIRDRTLTSILTSSLTSIRTQNISVPDTVRETITVTQRGYTTVSLIVPEKKSCLACEARDRARSSLLTTGKEPGPPASSASLGLSSRKSQPRGPTGPTSAKQDPRSDSPPPAEHKSSSMPWHRHLARLQDILGFFLQRQGSSATKPSIAAASASTSSSRASSMTKGQDRPGDVDYNNAAAAASTPLSRNATRVPHRSLKRPNPPIATTSQFLTQRQDRGRAHRGSSMFDTWTPADADRYTTAGGRGHWGLAPGLRHVVDVVRFTVEEYVARQAVA